MSPARNPILLLAVGAVLALAAHFDHPSQVKQEYDFVIAGAGAGGLTVANRLTEDSATSVLVVEYGDLADRERNSIPFFSNILDLGLAINISSTPQKHLGNRQYYIPIGGTVGGSTTINALVHDKGSAADFAAWAALGNRGWDLEGLQPYFEKSTKYVAPDPDIVSKYGYRLDPESWGTSGPVTLTFPPYQWPQLPYMLNATAELGFPIDGNFSGVGVTWVPSTQDPTSQTRITARTAYYEPIVGRANLDLLTGVQVTKLLLQDKTVTGVEIRSRQDSNNSSTNILARKETILAAGTLNTPNILHKSGIGPRSMLEDAGVPVLHELPGVGTNLQEAPGTFLLFNLTSNISPSLDMLLRVTATKAAFLQDNIYEHQVAEEYRQSRTGPFAKARPQSAAYLSLAATAPDSKDDILSRLSKQDGGDYLPSSYGTEARRGYALQHSILQDRLNGSESSIFELPFDGAGLLVAILQKPLSRGVVLLDPKDPTGLPVVDLNSFANPIDTLMLGAMVNFTRKLFQTDAMAPLKPLEIVPGSEFKTAEDIMQQLIKTNRAFASIARPSGTCPMMPVELGGVVDSDLRIHGLEKVSVVDASIIPMAPANRLGSTVYAIAEKASCMLKERHKA